MKWPVNFLCTCMLVPKFQEPGQVLLKCSLIEGISMSFLSRVETIGMDAKDEYGSFLGRPHI